MEYLSHGAYSDGGHIGSSLTVDGPNLMNDATAISELTGEPVSTWSEEWRHEREL
jgi:hypothetical protein